MPFHINKTRLRQPKNKIRQNNRPKNPLTSIIKIRHHRKLNKTLTILQTNKKSLKTSYKNEI